MPKKYPFYPLVLALYPLLFLIYRSIDQLRPETALRDGALWFLGGAGLFALAWAVLRSPERAALLAGFALLLVFAYDPVYELLRGTPLGRHRFLAPLWGVLLAVGAFFVARIKADRRLTLPFNAASLVVFVPLLGLVIGSGAWSPPLRSAGILPPPQVTVTFIDIGKRGGDQPGEIGDAILLQTSEGKTALIDAGYPNQMVTRYLAAHGINHLDLVVMTHPHDDHAGGLIDVLQAVKVDLLVHNGQPLDSDIYAQVAALIESSGVETHVARGGDQLPFGSLVLDVLSPVAISEDNINLNSIVTRLEVGAVAFLFTGDTYRYEEQRLVSAGIDLRANVLKLAHHGSDTSTDPAFVASVAPEVAVYSAGVGNEDGFPHAVTLATLDAAGVEVYGTDRYGTIVITTDGKTYEVVPELGGTE